MNELPKGESAANNAESALLNFRRAAPLETALNGEKTYRLSASGRSITGLVCGRESFHPEDIRHSYCGNCNMFHLPA